MNKAYLLVGLILSILIGCQATKGEITKVTPTSGPGPETPTLTATLNPTSTQFPTFTATATNVPVATLGIEDREEAIRFLFETNNNCDFPCWWGIIPGKTAWVEAEKFLKSLVLEFKRRESALFGGRVNYGIDVEVPLDIDNDGIESIGIMEDTDGMVYSISLSTSLEALRLDFPVFFERYGPPSEVYIWAIGYDSIARDNGRYSIAFYFETKGIMVQYEGRAFMGSELIDICSSEYLNNDAFLVFWDPKVGLSFEIIGVEAESVTFLPIGDISDLSVSGLYEQLAGAEALDFCFEIANPTYTE